METSVPAIPSNPSTAGGNPGGAVMKKKFPIVITAVFIVSRVPAGRAQGFGFRPFRSESRARSLEDGSHD
jgi:hypothetical protein